LYILIAFSIALLFAVYLSGLAERSPVSTSVIFLIAGFLIGPGALNLIQLLPSDPTISQFVEITLVTVLFTDGLEIDLHKFRSVWKLAGRALFLGLPLTLAIMAGIAHLMTGIAWSQALLLGAVLSPTDPVFASALVHQPAVPKKLKRLLNIESGLNDGLALPIILTFLALLNKEIFKPLTWIGELALGIAIGISVTWIVLKIKPQIKENIAKIYEPILAIAAGLLVYALAKQFHGNSFLASFAAGMTMVTMDPEISHEFLKIGQPISEVLKLASVLIFGSLLSISFFSGITPVHLLFALLVLLLARPIGLSLSLLGSSLPLKERLAAGWFGPRGFASVVYGLLVYRAAPQDASLLVSLIALVILLSIILHTTTDAFASSLFDENKQ
jgi:sodium/hydrogen antiporter